MRVFNFQFSIFAFAVAVALLSPSFAQETFTVANSEGVQLKYSIQAADRTTVSLVANNYTGRVVVPETVTYADTVRTVTSIGSAFANTTVSYVSLPATIVLSNGCFSNCNSLDSLRFVSVEPLALPASYTQAGMLLAMYFGSTSYDVHRVTLLVPCGSLAKWKKSFWRIFPTIKSDCSSYLSVVATQDSIVRLDGVPSSDLPTGHPIANGASNYCSGYYEIGDTAYLYYVPFKNTSGGLYRNGYALGWSDGSYDNPRLYPVNSYETIRCYVDTIPYSIMSVNQITTPVYLFGNMSYDPVSGSPHYTFFEGSNASTLYANSLWIGSGEHLAATRFSHNPLEYNPGPLRVTDGGTDIATVSRFNRVWHISRDMIDYHIAHCGDAGYVPCDDIRTWPGNGDSTAGYAAQLAPYYDADGDGRYRPLAGDYPLIRGDEAVFSIFNDVSSHGTTGGQPLGIEVHCMVYAFSEPSSDGSIPNASPIHKTIFVSYDIFNRSSNNYPETYLGAWADFDIGYGFDDYIGSDVRNGMFYGYNADAEDDPGNSQFYSNYIPAQGCMILGGAKLPADGTDNPKIDLAKMQTSYPDALSTYGSADGGYDIVRLTADADLYYPEAWCFTPGDANGNNSINGTGFGDGITDNERMGMTGFLYYENRASGYNSEPTKYQDYYYYMRGYWKNGNHMKYGGDGVSTGTTEYDCRFMYPGDSDPWNYGTDGIDPGFQWSEEQAGNFANDRRGLGSSGPFTFSAGGNEKFDLAFVAAWGYIDGNTPTSGQQVSAAASEVRRQWTRDTLDSGRPMLYRPYSAPHDVADDPDPSGIRSAESPNPQFLIYPNPTTGILHIVADVSYCQKAEILDIYGRRLMSFTVEGIDNTLDISTLPRGVYFLKIGNTTTKVVRK